LHTGAALPLHESIQDVIALLDALNIGALLVDRAGIIEYANDRLCAMLGRKREDLIGLGSASFYPDEKSRQWLSERLAAFDEAYEGEFHLPRLDGTNMAVILSGRPLGTKPPLSDHRLVTLLDISEQKKAEEKLQEEYSDIAKLSDTVLEQALELKRYSAKLEDRVRARTAELHQANMEAIFMLAVASEYKDADTGAHVRRIEHYTKQLAQEMGLPEEIADVYGYSAILHDVGKMLVSDKILKKPGPLEQAERGEMMMHAVAGERILSKQPFFEIARQIARSHHENWDGSGYPDRIAGESIPLPARIVHLADVYDALTSERVYKPAWSPQEAAKVITEAGGKHFDPEVVRAFQTLVDRGTFQPIRGLDGK
jgi:PAS domain S-box-containing protein